jgi:hypothetical protein
MPWRVPRTNTIPLPEIEGSLPLAALYERVELKA